MNSLGGEAEKILKILYESQVNHISHVTETVTVSSNDSVSSLNDGDIVAIASGVSIAVLVFITGIYLLLKRRTKNSGNSEKSEQSKNPESDEIYSIFYINFEENAINEEFFLWK